MVAHDLSSMSGRGCAWLVVYLSGVTCLNNHGGWLDPRFDLAGANGAIQSIESFRGDLYIAGYFTRIAGVDAPGFARWDGTRWEAVQFPSDVRVVAAVARPQEMYFALQCCRVDKPAGLARWDGQRLTLLGLPKGYRDILESAFLLDRGDVYAEVFPESTQLGLEANKALAKWDGNEWSVLAVTSSIGGGGLYDLAAAQGKIYGAGAIYKSGNGQQSLGLGLLVPPNWEEVDGGISSGLSVFGLASDGTNLLAQGSFTSTGGKPADGFAVWNGTNWVAPPAESRGGARIEAITSNEDEVLASEVISTDPLSGAVVSQHLVRYVGTNREVLARGDARNMKLMRRVGQGVYCTGGFRSVGGVPTGNLALWDGTNWSRVGRGAFHGLSSAATCLAASGTNIYAGGLFEFAGDAPAKHVARWDGHRWHALGEGINGIVQQMAARGEDLFVIGSFTAAGGSAVTNLARWNGTEWTGVGNGLGGELTAITATDQELFVARNVSSTNFVISRWQGSNWNDVTGGEFGYGRINRIMVWGNSIVVAGRFTKLNGQTVNNIARWDSRGWTSLGEGVSGEREWIPNDYPFVEVHAILSDGTNLYVGGSFTNAGGLPAKNIARWDGASWHALGSGIPEFGSCLFGSCVYPVTSIAIMNGKLFAGGGFTTNPERSRGFLTQWDGVNWTNVIDGNWSRDPGMPWDQLHVWALASMGSALYLAGNFATVDSQPSYGFGIWHESRPPRLDVKLNGGNVILSWPIEFQDAQLERTDSLASSQWSRVDGALLVRTESAEDVQVELRPGALQEFFRLRWE